MSNFKILAILGIASLTVITIVVRNTMIKVDRDYVVLYAPTFDICFLVDQVSYQFEVQDNSIHYSTGKKIGHIQLLKQQLSNDILKTGMNGFEGGYKKFKNVRRFEYKLNDEYILRDDFQNVSMGLANLVPYKNNCQKIMKTYPKVQKIFTE